MNNDGGKAFPVTRPTSQLGMSLRDYFAAAALTGLAQHKAVTARGTQWLVEHAYLAADAMLAEREK